MIKLIARVVEVCVTIGPGPPCPGDPAPLVTPRAVTLLRRPLGAILPPPRRWATLAAWHLALAAGRRLMNPAARPTLDRNPDDHHP